MDSTPDAPSASRPVSPQQLAEAIATLDAATGDPHPGRLPLDIFLLVSRLVPLFTVDLWIEDGGGRVLLTWRDDAHFGRGWHIPGSALRFGETIAHRLHECAREEVGALISCDPAPMALLEEITPHTRTRGHNVSAAYRCSLLTPPDPTRAYRGGTPQPGQWAWHATCPPDLLPVHHVYTPFFPSPMTNDELRKSSPVRPA